MKASELMEALTNSELTRHKWILQGFEERRQRKESNTKGRLWVYWWERKDKARAPRTCYTRDIIEEATHQNNEPADEDAVVTDDQWILASGSGSAQTTMEAEGGSEGNLPLGQSGSTYGPEDQDMESGDDKQ